MPNLRHMGTGQKLLKQVLLQTGSKVKHVTKQAEVKTIQAQKAPNARKK
jgi:hypothetical protein